MIGFMAGLALSVLGAIMSGAMFVYSSKRVIDASFVIAIIFASVIAVFVGPEMILWFFASFIVTLLMTYAFYTDWEDQ